MENDPPADGDAGEDRSGRSHRRSIPRAARRTKESAIGCGRLGGAGIGVVSGIGALLAGGAGLEAGTRYNRQFECESLTSAAGSTKRRARSALIATPPAAPTCFAISTIFLTRSATPAST